MKQLILLCAAIFCTHTLSSQTLAGTILDESLGDPLIGANVVIENTTIGTSTDLDGKYQFPAEPGTYNVVISYLGYQDKTVQEVIVKDGEITYLDVTLSDQAVELDINVTVTAKALQRSETAIMILQKKSDKIQDGISSQEMSKFSVGNAAGAMQKVTGATVEGGKYVFIRGLGDRYSTTQLNGLEIPSTDPYRNSAQLDLIPSSLLENIITSKTFTPDQPGYFTGGNVDITTKSFPEQFSLTVGINGSFNPRANLVDNFPTHLGSETDWLGYDRNFRSLSDVVRDGQYNGYLNDQSDNLAYRGDAEAAHALDITSKSFLTQVKPTARTSPINHGLSLAFGNQYTLFGKPLGVILSGTFNQSFQFLENFTTRNWRVLDIKDDVLDNRGDYVDNQSRENPRLSGLAGVSYKLSDYNQLSFNVIYSHNAEKTSGFLQGQRPDNILLVDDQVVKGYELSFIERELINYQIGGEHVLPGLNQAKIEWKGSYVSSTQDEPQTRFFENILNVKTGEERLGSNDLTPPTYFFRDLRDKQYVGKLDFTLPLGVDSGNKIKVGGLYSTKDRTFDQRSFQLKTSHPSARYKNFQPDLETFLSPSNFGIINVEEGENPSQDRYWIGNFFVDDTKPIDRYTGNESISSAYAMFVLRPLNKLKLVGGARVEHTDIQVETILPNDVLLGEIEGTDILPAINATYELTDEMNFRASYTHTLARPNMREIAPFSLLDVIRTIRLTGNTELEKTNIVNIDLRWEWFFKPGEIVAVSAYHKDFENPIIQTLLPSANVREIQYDNVSSAQLSGIEFEIRKSLGFINPYLDKFKLQTNISFISSETDVDDPSEFAPEKRPFQGQPSSIINAALIYSNIETGLDMTLSLNRVGDRLEQIAFGGTPDVYTRGRNQLDFTLLKKFGNMNVKLIAQNILDAEYRSSSTFKGSEFVYSSFRRGVNVGLGLSYTIR